MDKIINFMNHLDTARSTTQPEETTAKTPTFGEMLDDIVYAEGGTELLMEIMIEKTDLECVVVSALETYGDDLQREILEAAAAKLQA